MSDILIYVNQKEKDMNKRLRQPLNVTIDLAVINELRKKHTEKVGAENRWISFSKFIENVLKETELAK